MGTGSGAGSGWRAAAVVLLAGWVAGCGQATLPAPVFNATPPPRTITIEPGQTLSGIALAHHVPMGELAAVNHLSPPYKILAGGELRLPSAAVGSSGPPAPAAVAAVPPPAPAVPPLAPPPVHTAELTPPRPSTAPHPPPPSPEVAAPVAPHPTAAVAAGVESGSPAGHGAMFVWPVRGHIVEAYGPGPGGTHNDGINIAAPRGTPVEAAGAGTVAYAGDELRGYGNLILIKQPDGWISAYAHCGAILVKQGQKVAKGQVIARVGATGDVTAPQLHFELRRGDKPVDPQRYLPPPSSAAAQAPRAG
jgi:murein DD-endopeptidase MepM/ murein hydrolase activator NlpD